MRLIEEHPAFLKCDKSLWIAQAGGLPIDFDLPVDPQSTALFLQKRTTTTVAAPGDFVRYELLIENASVVGVAAISASMTDRPTARSPPPITSASMAPEGRLSIVSVRCIEHAHSGSASREASRRVGRRSSIPSGVSRSGTARSSRWAVTGRYEK